MLDRGWPLHCRLSLIFIALLLTVSMGSTLVHWHNSPNSQDCKVCHVRHDACVVPQSRAEPAIQLNAERAPLSAEAVYVPNPERFSSPGRAPPVTISLFA